MPMFYTPKPRRFKYEPRFYDPEKERWEALKQKYADERRLEEILSNEGAADKPELMGQAVGDADMEYFERRVREEERKATERKRGLTWKDMFRKREMPTFKYTPRFAKDGESGGMDDTRQDTGERLQNFKKRNIKIRRRFDISDNDYMKPVPATRIMLYALLVCLLIYWVVF